MTATEAPAFARPAKEERLQQVAARLRANNIETAIVDTGAEARVLVLSSIPEGTEVHTAASKTLEEIGLIAELERPGRYDPIRPRTRQMDRATQAREIRKLSAAPDYMIGSVHAVTEEGHLIVASGSGSQIGPYASSAGRLILVVGSQKIVRDVEEGMRRIREHVFPYEDARVKATGAAGANLRRILISYAEGRPGRTTVILVREVVGV